LLDWLQEQVKPRDGIELEPFLLHAYGIPVISRDQTTVDRIKRRWSNPAGTEG
jgi:hypothetical protein